MPSLNTTAKILLEIFSIVCCTVLMKPPMTSSLHSQKHEYVENEKRYSKKKHAILLYFERLFKKVAIVFYFIGTLSNCQNTEKLSVNFNVNKVVARSQHESSMKPDSGVCWQWGGALRDEPKNGWEGD